MAPHATVYTLILTVSPECSYNFSLCGSNLLYVSKCESAWPYFLPCPELLNVASNDYIHEQKTGHAIRVWQAKRAKIIIATSQQE